MAQRVRWAGAAMYGRSTGLPENNGNYPDDTRSACRNADGERETVIPQANATPKQVNYSQ